MKKNCKKNCEKNCNNKLRIKSVHKKWKQKFWARIVKKFSELKCSNRVVKKLWTKWNLGAKIKKKTVEIWFLTKVLSKNCGQDLCPKLWTKFENKSCEQDFSCKSWVWNKICDQVFNFEHKLWSRVVKNNLENKLWTKVVSKTRD